MSSERLRDWDTFKRELTTLCIKGDLIPGGGGRNRDLHSVQDLPREGEGAGYGAQYVNHVGPPIWVFGGFSNVSSAICVHLLLTLYIPLHRLCWVVWRSDGRLCDRANGGAVEHRRLSLKNCFSLAET